MFLVKTSLVLLRFRLYVHDFYCYRNIFLFTKNLSYVTNFFVLITFLCVLCPVTTFIIIIVQILLSNATCAPYLYLHYIPFLFLLKLFVQKISYATLNRNELWFYNNIYLYIFHCCLNSNYLISTFTYHSLSSILYFTYHGIPISSYSFLPTHIHYNAS